MPHFHDHMHYAQVAAVLRAADVDSRIVTNAEHTMIVVHLEDGSRIIWGNPGATWAYTMIREPEGDGEVFAVDTLLDQGAMPDVVAQVIAEWPYASKPVSVLADG